MPCVSPQSIDRSVLPVTFFHLDPAFTSIYYHNENGKFVFIYTVGRGGQNMALGEVKNISQCLNKRSIAGYLGSDLWGS